MAKHIISTLSADTRFVEWGKAPGVSTVRRGVVVRGGAGVALLGAGQQTVTPAGVRTQVSDEDAAFLQNHPMFKDFMARGFIKVENIARDPDTVAQKMEEDDGSRPRNPEDVRKAADEAAARTGLTPDESLQAVTNKKK